MKKRVIFCAMDDSRDPSLVKGFVNSIRKFHDELELPIEIVRRSDEEAWINDPDFYYRAKGLIASKYIQEYELVIVADADQICMGDLNFIIDRTDYDIGTVLNWNRTDPQTYGLVSVFNIDPREYYNAGLIAFRSEELVSHLDRLCHSKYFYTLQYREQDILNLMLHYGNYKVRCFDVEDKAYDYNAWHGLIAKGEGTNMVLKDDRVYLLPDDTGYPSKTKIIKLYHYAGGNTERKNHRTQFTEELIEHIDWLLSDAK